MSDISVTFTTTADASQELLTAPPGVKYVIKSITVYNSVAYHLSLGKTIGAKAIVWFSVDLDAGDQPTWNEERILNAGETLVSLSSDSDLDVTIIYEIVKY